MKVLESIMDDYLENLNLHYSELSDISYKDEYDARQLLKTMEKVFHKELEEEINLEFKKL